MTKNLTLHYSKINKKYKNSFESNLTFHYSMEVEKGPVLT